VNQHTPHKSLGSVVGDKDWWRGAIVYQIYPRSYQDSNGDGIGDLLGIVSRIPYIASLGVDAIWISPFFTSPMKDFGYDVSDYCDVDPMFGSLADFDAVVETAHHFGIKVMIDLVLSHTSNQHHWFQESVQSRDNDKADWYVWSDPKGDGTPPNNWLSIFGGSAWQWEPRREQYFLHNFLKEQPDLNFHTPAVQDALLDVARFWLNRGVNGFRLDTINFYVHDSELRDNPGLPPDRRNATIAPSVNPYNHQEHLYDKNRPENIDFLRKLRALMEPFGAAAVGEVGDAQRGLEILGEYTRGDDLMQMCYAFEFLSGDQPQAADVANVLAHLDAAAPDGWACWAFSNHDVTRHASRWDLSPSALRMFTTLMMCLRGSVCIYQGDELGLPEADLNFEDLQDPLWNRVLARIQGPRRLPDADGLGPFEPERGVQRGPSLVACAGRALQPFGQRAGARAGRAIASLPACDRLPSRPRDAAQGRPRQGAIRWGRAVLYAQLQRTNDVLCLQYFGHAIRSGHARGGLAHAGA